MQLGFRRNQLFELILRVDPEHHRAQGSVLRVVGHNKGGATALRLHAQPRLLERLESTVGVPVRHLHVLRNPFDNIAAIHSVRTWTAGALGAVEFYGQLCEGVGSLKQRVPASELLDVRHEELLADPEQKVSAVCEFLGVDAPDHYLAACRRQVQPPHAAVRSRFPWTPDLRARVDDLIAAHDFLDGYSFET